MNQKESAEETRDVTIRGVDRILYDEFTFLAKSQGINVGKMFNYGMSMITSQIRPPFSRFCQRSRSPHRIKERVRPEIVRNLEKLVVKAEHLTEAGKKVVFMFINIGQLEFDETVTSEILSRHVRGIKLCKKVIMSKKISKLIKLGLEHSYPKYAYPDESGLKDITIRRVSSNLYDAFASEATKKELSYGEYFSQILSRLNHHLQISIILHSNNFKHPIVVDNVEELRVTLKDLEVLKEREILFYNIDKLVFEDEIYSELFIKRVGKIVKCRKVQLPATLPYLIGISRTEESKIITAEKKE